MKILSKIIIISLLIFISRVSFSEETGARDGLKLFSFSASLTSSFESVGVGNTGTGNQFTIDSELTNFLLSIEYLPISYIGIEFHVGSGKYTRIGTSLTKEYGFFNSGIMGVVHPIKEYFLDPFVGIGFDFGLFIEESISGGEAGGPIRTGTGYKIKVGTNVFVTPGFFVGTSYSYVNLKFDEVVDELSGYTAIYYPFVLKGSLVSVYIGAAW